MLFKRFRKRAGKAPKEVPLSSQDTRHALEPVLDIRDHTAGGGKSKSVHSSRRVQMPQHSSPGSRSARPVLDFPVDPASVVEGDGNGSSDGSFVLEAEPSPVSSHEVDSFGLSMPPSFGSSGERATFDTEEILASSTNASRGSEDMFPAQYGIPYSRYLPPTDGHDAHYDAYGSEVHSTSSYSETGIQTTDLDPDSITPLSPRLFTAFRNPAEDIPSVSRSSLRNSFTRWRFPVILRREPSSKRSSRDDRSQRGPISRRILEALRATRPSLGLSQPSVPKEAAEFRPQVHDACPTCGHVRNADKPTPSDFRRNFCPSSDTPFQAVVDDLPVLIPRPLVARKLPGFPILHMIHAVASVPRQLIGKVPSVDLRRQSGTDEKHEDDLWPVLQLNRLRIPPVSRHRRWLSGGELGRGSFGTVYLVLDLRTRQMVAMKVVNHHHGLSAGACKGIVNELRILDALARIQPTPPYILMPYLGYDLWAWRSSAGYIHVLTDYCPGGNLYDYAGRLPWRNIRYIAAELIIGLEFLHRNGIVHHDLKLENVLVDDFGHCAIADFGGCREMVNGSLTLDSRTDVIATPSYAAPELLEGVNKAGRTYDESVDYWSLGVMMGELFTGKNYFSGSDSLAKTRGELFILRDELEQKLRLDMPAMNFINDLLMMDPSQRLKGPAIFNHEYFSGISWIDIATKRHEGLVRLHRPAAKKHGFAEGHVQETWSGARYNLDRMLDQSGIELQVDESFDVSVVRHGMVSPL
ncbi:hypothetical protein AcV5_009493 [Taiwanofungus camphoratus]|nr:hypothetical protein AcV5_009493 [Antrodia cinnamomea]